MQQIPDKLISVYMEGSLSAAQSEELSQWVKASRENALYLASLATLEQGLIKQAKVQSTSDILAELERDEEDAPVFASVPDETPEPIQLDPNTLTKEKYLSALSYVVRHTFTPKRVAVLATAAALLLGVAVTIMVLSGPGPEEQIAQEPDDQGEPNELGPVAPPVSRVVATLTAERDTAWDRQPGQDLYAGDRFTLTQGSAEITTHRGAVAILEAPATIELLNNDNALRLHTGKLVGICETESSRGFLVRTPQMDITDLGTRFGVDCSTPGITEVHVHQGEVIVAKPGNAGTTNPRTQRITANQAVRAVASVDGFVLTEPAFDRFDPALSTYQLRNTGIGLAEGTVDPAWLIVADANGPLDTPAQLVVERSKSKDLPHHGATDNDPDVAQWLFFSTKRSQYYPLDAPAGMAPRRLVLETRVDLPDTIRLQDMALYLRYSYNQGIDAIEINGQAVELPPIPRKEAGEPFFVELEFPIDQTTLRHGENTIRFDLPNNHVPHLFRFQLQWELRPASKDNTTQGETRP